MVFVFPLGAIIYLYKKERITMKAVGVGALTFFLFQIMTRIPLLSFLSTQSWFQGLAVNLFFSAVLVGGLSAGLFEEVGRYLAFRYPLKRDLSWQNGVAFGLGHGGIEAIVLVGITYIMNIVISIMINTGQFENLIGPGLDAATAATIKSQLVNTPPVYFLIGGLERFFTLFIQVGLSLVVLYGVRTRQIKYLVYAILLHTLVNAPPVILLERGANIWWVELYVFIVAASAGFWIVRARSLLRQQATVKTVEEGAVENGTEGEGV